MKAVVIRNASELQDGMRALIDTDLVTPEDAVSIGQEFRMHGVELIVTTRPGVELEYELQRNISGTS